MQHLGHYATVVIGNFADFKLTNCLLRIGIPVSIRVLRLIILVCFSRLQTTAIRPVYGIYHVHGNCPVGRIGMDVKIVLQCYTRSTCKSVLPIFVVTLNCLQMSKYAVPMSLWSITESIQITMQNKWFLTLHCYFKFFLLMSVLSLLVHVKTNTCYKERNNDTHNQCRFACALLRFFLRLFGLIVTNSHRTPHNSSGDTVPLSYIARLRVCLALIHNRFVRFLTTKRVCT